MQRFLVRRLVITVFTLLAVSLIVFVTARVSGDPRITLLNEFSTQEQWDALGLKLGLDKPYHEQYWIFLKDLLRGDFGRSIKQQRPAMDVIKERILATIELGAAAFFFQCCWGCL